MIAQAAHVYELIITAIEQINAGEIDFKEKESIKALVKELNKDDYKGKTSFDLKVDELYKSYLSWSRQMIKNKMGGVGKVCKASDYLNRLSKYVHSKPFEVQYGKFNGDLRWDSKKKVTKKIKIESSKLSTDSDDVSMNFESTISGESIRKYLTKGIGNIKGVDFTSVYNRTDKSHRGSDLEDIFVPPYFKVIQNLTPKSPNIGSENKPNSKQQAIGTSKEHFLSVKIKIFDEVFGSENEGIGFVADLGTGKTTLCQALFCLFANRILGNHNDNYFWREFNEQKINAYIPILFCCNKLDLNKDISNVREFITESVRQIGFVNEGPLEKSITDQLLLMYDSDKVNLLFLVDALDEYNCHNGISIEASRAKFFDFLHSNFMTLGSNQLVYTKRNYQETKIKKKTIQLKILPLDEQQQRELVTKVFEHTGFIGNVDTLLAKLDSEIKKNSYYLTNAIFYFIEHNKIPNGYELEDALVKIYFERKVRGVYNDILEEFLTQIALKMNENSIQERELKTLINDFFKKNPSIKAISSKENILYWLWNTIGIFIRKYEGADNYVFQFQLRKHWDILFEKGMYKYENGLSGAQLEMKNSPKISKNEDNPKFDTYVKQFLDNWSGRLNYINKMNSKGNNE